MEDSLLKVKKEFTSLNRLANQINSLVLVS